MLDLKTATKIGVEIITVSNKTNGKVKHVYIETDSLLGATRFINSFQPKRNYSVAMIKIEEVGVLTH